MEIGGVKPDAGHIPKVEPPALEAGNVLAKADTVAANLNTISVDAVINNSHLGISTTALKDLLISFGQSPGEDNIAIIRALSESGLPSDKGSFLKLNQALKLFNLLTGGENSGNLDKAIFTIKNDLPANLESVEKFQAFLGEAGNVSKNLTIVQETLINAPHTPAIEQIMRIFTDSLPGGQGNALLSSEAAPPVITGTPLAAPLASQGDVPPIINSQLREILSLPPDTRGELIKGLSEILARPPLPGGGIDFQAVTTEIAKFSNSSQPLTESAAKELITQLFKEMPELTHIAGISGNMAEFVDLSSTTISSNRPPVTVPELIRAFESLRLTPQENSPQALEEALNNLKFKTEEALKIANNSNSSDDIPAALSRALENINNNLSFIDQLKTCVYVPIPLNTPIGQTEGELYIFKDGRGKTSKSGAKTALIGLNTVSIGRVEAYIQKEDNRLNLQFRLENPNISNLIKEHTAELMELMDSANLKLIALSTTGLDTPFNLLQKEPDERSVKYKLSDYRFDTKA
ncbi:MAG: flagellar hook-length control protein FliK [Defluviitaleaceae bacterium]|nr:flagellar hook-length control protein FliK [Defluviitaleaceae bacterium]